MFHHHAHLGLGQTLNFSWQGRSLDFSRAYAHFPKSLSPHQKFQIVLRCLDLRWGYVGSHESVFSQSKWPWVNQRANGHAHVDKTFDRFQTLRNNSQPHATKSNRVWKRIQHITFNNTGPKMFRPFTRGLSCKFFLLYKYWWNTRTFPFTKKSYLHRAQ